MVGGERCDLPLAGQQERIEDCAAFFSSQRLFFKRETMELSRSYHRKRLAMFSVEGKIGTILSEEMSLVVDRSSIIFSRNIYQRAINLRGSMTQKKGKNLRGSDPEPDHNKQKLEPDIPDDHFYGWGGSPRLFMECLPPISDFSRIRSYAKKSVHPGDLLFEYETYKNYFEQACLSDGFDVTDYPEFMWYLPHKPVSIDDSPFNPFYVDITAAATFAIYHYNHRVDHVHCFVFSKLLRVTSTHRNGYEFRITFEATDDQVGHKTFQAQVFLTFKNRFEIYLCRLKDENMDLEIPSRPPKIKDRTYSDWRPAELNSRVPPLVYEKNSSSCFKRLDDLDAKTAATMSILLLNAKLQLRHVKEYMFSKLVSASFTSIGNDRVFNVTFEATSRGQDLNTVRTFEARVWQLYPSWNLEVEYCRLKRGPAPWDCIRTKQQTRKKETGKKTCVSEEKKERKRNIGKI